MVDMEKVIRGLEMCVQPSPSYCARCPYKEAPDNYPHCVHQGLQPDALALLRELNERLREREQPTLRNMDEKDKPLRMMRHICGAVIVYRGRDVCPNCGKAVDWGV